MNMFAGQYQQSMGDDRSLEIPAAFRELLASGAYITRGFEQDLLIMSASQFQEICRRVASLNMADPAVRLLQRLILGSASRLDMDGNGRIIIPAELASFAGLQKEIILVGQGEYVEAWSPAAWQKQTELLLDFAANSTRFAQLDLSFT